MQRQLSILVGRGGGGGGGVVGGVGFGGWGGGGGGGGVFCFGFFCSVICSLGKYAPGQAFSGATLRPNGETQRIKAQRR